MSGGERQETFHASASPVDTMGLFEKAGRHVERFKQRASEAAREEADYECADCGASLYANAETCPDCGAEAVVEREPDDAEAESAGAADGDDAEGDGAGEDAV